MILMKNMTVMKGASSVNSARKAGKCHSQTAQSYTKVVNVEPKPRASHLKLSVFLYPSPVWVVIVRKQSFLRHQPNPHSFPPSSTVNVFSPIGSEVDDLGTISRKTVRQCI
jgi:hypothetical protein